MYTPHQKGILTVSAGDALTVNWLYTFPQGATTSEIASKYGVNGGDIDEVVLKIMEKRSKKMNDTPEIKDNKPSRSLLDEQESIANLKKYHLSLQNITISPDAKKFFSKPPQKHT